MPSNIEARVASLRKAQSDGQAVTSSRSTSKSTPAVVRQPYSSWLERDGERVEQWLAEQKVDAVRRRASIQEQTALLEDMSVKMNEKPQVENAEDNSKQKEPKMGIARRWTTGEVGEEGNLLMGVGAFAGEETPRQTNPQLSFSFSQPEDEPMPDAPPQDTAPDVSQDRPMRS